MSRLDDNKIDAGPMITYPVLSADDFKNFEFQERALQFLSISIIENLALRYAIYCSLEKTAESSTWHTFAEASLPTNAGPEEQAGMDELVGRGNWVKPESKALTGLVHQETEEHSKKYCVKTQQWNILDCISNGRFKLGFSCRFDPIKKKFSIIVRSTMQYSIQKIATHAKYAFYYHMDQPFDKENEVFTERKYTLQFHIERAAELFIIKIFAAAFTHALNQYLKKDHSHLVQKEWVDLSETYNENYTLEYHNLWKIMRFDKLLLAQYYQRNFYISSSLREEEAGDFWPKETDAEVAAMCIKLSLELGISFNPDEIPNEFKHLTKKSALLQACRKTTKDALMLVMLLIENGAVAGLASSEILQFAENNPNPEVFNYVNTIRELIWGIRNNDIQRINTHLNPNVIMIDRPICNGMTPLALSVDNIDSSFVTTLAVLKVLEENKEDFRSSKKGCYLKYRSPLQVAADKNNFRKLIFLLCLGLDPADLSLTDKHDIKGIPGTIVINWSKPDWVRGFLDNLITNSISVAEAGHNQRNLISTKDEIKSFQKFKKTIIHARKIVELKGHAPECYWKEVDSLIRCALSIKELLFVESPDTRRVFLNTLDMVFKDIMILTPEVDLLFSPHVIFPVADVTPEDENLFDKDISIAPMPSSPGSNITSLFNLKIEREEKSVIDFKLIKPVNTTILPSLSMTPIPDPDSNSRSVSTSISTFPLIFSVPQNHAPVLPALVLVKGFKSQGIKPENYFLKALLIGDGNLKKEFLETVSNTPQDLGLKAEMISVNNHTFQICDINIEKLTTLKTDGYSVILFFGNDSNYWKARLRDEHNLRQAYIPKYLDSGKVILTLADPNSSDTIPEPMAVDTTWQKYAFNLLSAISVTVPIKSNQNSTVLNP